MKIRKLLSVLAAAAVAVTTVSALATTASAADSYNGYIGFQDTLYSFRNNYTEINYGRDTQYFNSVIVWGNNDPENFPEHEDKFDYDIEGYVFPATFSDAAITANGTYTASVADFDWSLDGASSFNTLFLSTDIPLDSGITLSNLQLLVDGEVVATQAEPFQNPDNKTTYEVLFANIWNNDLESYSGKYPTSTLAIQFDVAGFEETASAEEDGVAADAADTAPAVDSTSNPGTGVSDTVAVAASAILVCAVIAGVATSKKSK